MVEVNTRVFGKIAVEDDKIIRFESGILEEQCSEILTEFFKSLREKKAGN